MTKQLIVVSVLTVAIAVLLVMAVVLSFIRAWVKSMSSGAPVSLLRIIGMRLRGYPTKILIDAHILLTQQKLVSTLDETEHTYRENRNRIRSSDDLIRLVKEKKGQRR